MTEPARFTQLDVQRAVKGVRAAGVQACRIELDTSGKIVILIGESAGLPANDENEWDEVLEP